MSSQNQFPRRSRLYENTPAELSIRSAIDEVEKLGADVKLTEVITLLGDALTKLHDFVDSKIEN